MHFADCKELIVVELKLRVKHSMPLTIAVCMSDAGEVAAAAAAAAQSDA
jgi:hypothetical protein